jgi:hypothetical protein
VAGLVVVVLFVLSGIDSVTPINWYRVDAPSELTVGITTGPSGWWRVTDVRETPDTVTITVHSLELNFGPQAAIGYPRELAVHLAQPLGDRVVFDGLGQAVFRQPSTP